MDFARKQLEKYGWSEGKGLGKNENGIAKALKPKLKRNLTGVGHDAGADFTDHWWTDLYNKAATNIQVEEKNGKTKKIKTVDSSEFVITNSMWHLKKAKKEMKKNTEEKKYGGHFIRTELLDGGTAKIKKIRKSESDTEDEKRDVFKMTDEELFAACEGRTVHKGARHGLNALGKLARIEQQEKLLLTQPKYEAYSCIEAKKNELINSSELCDNKLEGLEIGKLKKRKNKSFVLCNNEVSNCDDTDVKSFFDSEELDNTDANVLKMKKKKKKNKLKVGDHESREYNGNHVNHHSVKVKKHKREVYVSTSHYSEEKLNYKSCDLEIVNHVNTHYTETTKGNMSNNTNMFVVKNERKLVLEQHCDGVYKLKKRKKARNSVINYQSNMNNKNTDILNEMQDIDEENNVSSIKKKKKKNKKTIN